MKRATSIANIKLHQGFTFVELVVFIVVVSVAIAGVIVVFTQVTKNSVDPQIRKQQVLVAEAMMDEIQLQPYTWCDANDANTETATSAAGCTITNAIGPEAGEARAAGFDHVDDYHGYASTGVRDALGNAVAGLENYNVAVTVANGALLGIPATDALRILVVVTHVPTNASFRLESLRTRYAPNAGP